MIFTKSLLFTGWIVTLGSTAQAGYSFVDDYSLRLQAEQAQHVLSPQVYRPGMSFLYTESFIGRRTRIVDIVKVDSKEIQYRERYIFTRLAKCEGRIERETGRELEFSCNGVKGPTTDRQPIAFTHHGTKVIETEKGKLEAHELRFTGSMGAQGPSQDTVYISELAPGPGVIYHVSVDGKEQMTSEWLD